MFYSTFEEIFKTDYGCEERRITDTPMYTSITRVM